MNHKSSNLKEQIIKYGKKTDKIQNTQQLNVKYRHGQSSCLDQATIYIKYAHNKKDKYGRSSKNSHALHGRKYLEKKIDEEIEEKSKQNRKHTFIKIINEYS